MNEKTLYKFFSCLKDGVSKKQIELYKKIIGESKIEEYDNIEGFFYGIIYPFDNFISGYIKTEISLDDDVEFIFKNSRYLERHLSTLFSQREGGACSADKSSTIISLILNHYKTGETIAFNYEGEYTFHLPKKVLKSHEDIIAFYKGLKSLYYGNPQEYLIELQKTITNETKNQ